MTGTTRRLERTRELADVERVDENARLGRHELGRAADPGRDDGPAARHRLEDRLAERLDQRGAQTTSAALSQPGTSSCGTRPTTRTPVASLERRAKRAVADEGQ